MDENNRFTKLNFPTGDIEPFESDTSLRQPWINSLGDAVVGAKKPLQAQRMARTIRAQAVQFKRHLFAPTCRPAFSGEADLKIGLCIRRTMTTAAALLSTNRESGQQDRATRFRP